MQEKVNTRQLYIGFNILVLGAIFYYFFRPAEHTYFLKFFGSNPFLKDFPSPFWALLGNCLPTFIHVFAFIMMTSALVANRERGYLTVTLAWFAIDVLFEIGQGFGSSVIQIIPDWFSDYFLLENIRSYFLKGRFDYLDLLSIALGSLAAYILLINTKKNQGKECVDEK